jgi:hypothetical protein
MARWLLGTHHFVGPTRFFALALLGAVLSVSPALAIFPGGGDGGGGGGGGTGGSGGGGGGGGQVPEIGLGAAASALTLLIGVTLIAWDRRRKDVSQAEPTA